MKSQIFWKNSVGNSRLKRFSATLIIFLIFILTLNIVSAFEFDNVKDYDSINKEVTITNLFGIGGDIVKAKLITPQNVRVGLGYQKVAEFNIVGYTDYTDLIDTIKFYNLREDFNEITPSFDIRYLTTTEVLVNDYREVCNVDEKTLNETCIMEVSGTHLEERESWEKLTKIDMVEGTELRIGIFTDVKASDRVEWIPTFAGVEVEEWAEWTADLNTDLIAYYNMDGATITDRLGNFDLTNSGADSGQAGKVGSSFYFDGGTDYAYGNLANSFNNGVTFAVWFKNVSTPDNYGGIINIDTSDLMFRQNSASDDLMVQGNANTFNIASSGNEMDGTWHFGVFTYNSSIAQLWVDGTSVGIDSSISGLFVSSTIELGRNEQDNTYSFKGYIDEVGIWNRTLTPAEITQLYNGGTGLTYVAGDPVVSLNSPVNETNSSSALITFNATATSDPVNMSLWSNSSGTWALMNTSTVTGAKNTTTWVNTFSDGYYVWNVEACNSLGVCSFDSNNRTFRVDTTPPQISISSPTSLVDFGGNGGTLDLNVTFTDTNLDTCWYDYNHINVTIDGCLSGVLNSTSFTLTSQKNVTAWANDTAGNTNLSYVSWNYRVFNTSESFNLVVGEGTLQPFSMVILTNESVSTANLIYNGTSYSGTLTFNSANNYTISRDLVIPIVSTDEVDTFYWSITLGGGTVINTSINSQNITDFSIDDCSANNLTILNYTLLSEEGQVLLNSPTDNGTIELTTEIWSTDLSTSISNYSHTYTNRSNATVCLSWGSLDSSSYSLSSVVRYSAVNYVTEFNHIQNYTLTSSTAYVNITLFDLLSDDNTDFLITYKDSNFRPVENALINIQRYYVGEGTFKSVEIPKTDINGQTVGHFDREGVAYSITVTKNGHVLAIFNNIAVVCANSVIGDCSINLNSLSTSIPLDNWDTYGNVSLSNSFDSSTRTLTSLFTVTTGATKNVTLVVYNFDGYGNDTICNTGLVSSSGSLSCVIPVSYGNTTVIAKIFSNSELIWTQTFKIAESYKDIFEGNQIILILVLVLTIPFMLISTPIGAVIGVVIGVLMAGALLIFNGGSIIGPTSAMIWLIVAGGIVIWKISQRE